jgi:hypothetical protein
MDSGGTPYTVHLRRGNGWRAAKVSWLRSATLRQDAVRGGPEAPPYPRPMRAPRDLWRCVPSSARPARSGLPGYGDASRPPRPASRRTHAASRLISPLAFGFPASQPRVNRSPFSMHLGAVAVDSPRLDPIGQCVGQPGKARETEGERPRLTDSVAFQGNHWPAVSGSGDDSASILGSQAGFLAPAPQGVSHGSWVQHRGARPEVHKT